MEQLTARQQREFDYHRSHASKHEGLLRAPIDWQSIEAPQSRWWNAYWSMWALLQRYPLAGKEALVIGCGFGDDALRLAKLGARVCAFDLSPDSLRIARGLAEREGLAIEFAQMPAERLSYPDGSFDLLLARDILHHVDIPATMRELVRVARPQALMVVNEIYSHSSTELVRRSRFVQGFLYPRMQRLIYGPGVPYITADERKLTERDVAQVAAALGPLEGTAYFHAVVTRLLPERLAWAAQADRLALRVLAPLGRFLAGRVMFAGRVRK